MGAVCVNYSYWENFQGSLTMSAATSAKNTGLFSQKIRSHFEYVNCQSKIFGNTDPFWWNIITAASRTQYSHIHRARLLHVQVSLYIQLCILRRLSCCEIPFINSVVNWNTVKFTICYRCFCDLEKYWFLLFVVFYVFCLVLLWLFCVDLYYNTELN